MNNIQVLMSTYNGGENIIGQVRSIFEQEGVNVWLTIRDDGSNQETIDILKKLKKKYPCIDVFFGKNIGYKRSFLTLLNYAKDDNITYYAFADQDDIWKKNKLKRAIEKLNDVNEKVKLYISSLELYNENLNYLKINDVSRFPSNIYSLFTRTRYAGCTFVFSKELLELTRGYENSFKINEIPEHDTLIAAFAYTYGKVVIDSESYIKHIRYSNSVTSGGNGLKKRIQNESKNIFLYKNLRLNLAQILLNSNEKKKKISNQEVINYLKQVCQYKNKISAKLFLLGKVNCGSKICNIETMVKILLNNF